jgi:hypothetical protein
MGEEVGNPLLCGVRGYAGSLTAGVECDLKSQDIERRCDERETRRMKQSVKVNLIK